MFPLETRKKRKGRSVNPPNSRVILIWFGFQLQDIDFVVAVVLAVRQRCAS